MAETVQTTSRRRSSLRGGREDRGSLVDEKGTSERLYSILTGGEDPAAGGAGAGEQQSPSLPDQEEAEAGSSSAQPDAAGGDGGVLGAAAADGGVEERRRGSRQAAVAEPPKPPDASTAAAATSEGGETAATGSAAPAAAGAESSGTGGGAATAGQGCGGPPDAMRRISSLPAEMMPAAAVIEEVPPTPAHERLERDREAFVATICTEESHPDVRRKVRHLYISGLLAWPAPEKPAKEKKAVTGVVSEQPATGGEEAIAAQGGEDGGAGGGRGGPSSATEAESSEADAETESVHSVAGSLEVQVCISEESVAGQHQSPSSSGGEGEKKGAKKKPPENEEAKLKRYLATRTKEQDDWVKGKVAEMVSQVHTKVNHRVDTQDWARLASKGVLGEEANRLRLQNMKRQKIRKELDKHMAQYLSQARLEALKEWEDRHARGIIAPNLELEEKEGEMEQVFKALTKPTVANDPKKRQGLVLKFPPLKMSYSLPVDWKQRSTTFGLT